jgi:hypothetical protein
MKTYPRTTRPATVLVAAAALFATIVSTLVAGTIQQKCTPIKPCGTPAEPTIQNFCKGIGCVMDMLCQSPGDDWNCTDSIYMAHCHAFQFSINDEGDCCLPAADMGNAG